LQREKVRIYALARELNIDSKDLLEMCRQAGYDVKNQLSSLDPEQRDQIEVLVKRGGSTSTATAVAPPPPLAAPSPIPVLTSQKPRNLSARPAKPTPQPVEPVEAEIKAPPTASPTAVPPAVKVAPPSTPKTPDHTAVHPTAVPPTKGEGTPSVPTIPAVPGAKGPVPPHPQTPAAAKLARERCLRCLRRDPREGRDRNAAGRRWCRGLQGIDWRRRHRSSNVPPMIGSRPRSRFANSSQSWRCHRRSHAANAI